MSSSKFDELVNRLYERTEKGQVNWQPTSDEDEFIVYFQDLSLSMRTGIDEDEDEFITIALRNQSGKTVDSRYFWGGMSDKSMWEKVSALFSAARRIALKIDEAFDQIMKELDSKGIVGKADDKQK
jgi:hypothetical protein